MRCSRSLLLGFLSLCISLVRAHITDHEDFDTPLSASQDSFPEHITLQQWPSDAARPSPLGRIAYDPQTKQGKYFALGQSAGGKVQHGFVRVGMQVANGEWFGTVVDAEALDPAKYNPEVTIHVDRFGKVFHVEFSTSDQDTPPKVIVLPPTNGPTPALNKPVVVGPDGRIPEPPAEKTFLQKYWWLILAGMVLLLSGGGGEQ